jgi:putative addiction module antidote
MATEVTKIRKVGNSMGVILPQKILEGQGLKLNDLIEIRVMNSSIELRAHDDEFARRVEIIDRSHRKFRNAYRELAK